MGASVQIARTTAVAVGVRAVNLRFSKGVCP